ncbi:condensation domain-containing protein [Nocardia thailandica]|uniref:condensation domain-containing protein n=1 Tax=Nocardia thailandica TaxID=257275 RepID=UPI0002E1EDA9|nr:condensation domain-containing protein [Nocardia thailandica]
MFDPGTGIWSGGFAADGGALVAPGPGGVRAHCHRPPLVRPAALTRVPRPARLPLAPAQERMWDAVRRGRSADWNVAKAVRLRGMPIDTEALCAAVRSVVARHEPLRTRFLEGDTGPVQVIEEPAELDVDLAVRPCAEPELADVLGELACRPFDLAGAGPIRARVFVLAPDDVVLALVVHHIAVDGRSLGPLVRDLVTAYLAHRDGTPPDWRPLPVGYGDYTLWKHAQLGEFTDEWSRATQQLRYWANALAGRPALLDLPARDPADVAVDADPVAGGLLPVSLPPRVHAGLLALARQGQASLLMVLQAAFALSVGAFARCADVTVATAVSGRDHRLLDDLVGNFSDDVLLRVRLDRSADVDELLDQVRRVALAAYAHPDTPNPRLKRCLMQDARLPLFQATLILQRADAARVARADTAAPGLSVSEVPTGVVRAKHDLEFGLTEHYDPAGAPAGIDGAFLYPLARFDRATVRSFLRRFEAVVEMLAGGYRGPLVALLAATDPAVVPVRARQATRILV